MPNGRSLVSPRQVDKQANRFASCLEELCRALAEHFPAFADAFPVILSGTEVDCARCVEHDSIALLKFDVFY